MPFLAVLLVAPLLLPAIAAHAADDLVTAPEECVFMGFPYELAYLQEEGLVLMRNGGGVYAFDVASGKERWHRLLPVLVDPLHAPYQGASLGQRQVLFWSDPELVLLDMKTGRETWRQRDTQSGELQWAYLSPDESQILAVCAKHYILFSVAGRTQHILPRTNSTPWCTWLAGSKTLLFSQWKEEQGGRVQKWVFMDTDSGAMTPGREWNTSSGALRPTYSSAGQCAEAISEGKDSTTLRISDARTGAPVHECEGMPGRTRSFNWMHDARRLLYLTADKKQARVVDGETGLVQCFLSQDGHRFTSNRPFEDASEHAWIFSTDAARNLFAWPLTPGGTPQKVLDGALVGPPGAFQIHVGTPPYALFSQITEDRMETKTAYALDGLRKIAEWRFPLLGGGVLEPMINQAVTHLVCTRQTGKDNRIRPQNLAFSVFVQDKTTPVCKGSGEPIAVSPDGRFLVVKNDDKTACLYDVQTDKVVCQYDVFWDNSPFQPSMHATFSDNNARFVLNTMRSIEVTDLTGGYARRLMVIGEDIRIAELRSCLSPDGSRVLCWGIGRAWLFDADTGALLRSFEEPEHAAPSDAPDAGFRHGFLNAAFADGGTRIITHDGGQTIQVWDAGSGDLLYAIPTGLLERRNPRPGIRNRIVLSANGRFAFCYDNSKSSPASLWSLVDGTLLHRYRMPESNRLEVVPSDDGTAVYIRSNYNLYRWPGAPKENPKGESIHGK